MIIKELDVFSFDEIKALFKTVFTGPPWNEEWQEAQLSEYLHDLIDVRGSLVYGLYENDQLIGLSIGKINHWCAGTKYFIEELCIRNEYQGMGFGQGFISLIKNDLKQRGISQIFLMTDREKPAYKFYKKMGFKELPELTSFHAEF